MFDWDIDITLVGKSYTPDEYGNQVAEPTETIVQAAEQKINKYEFYQAAQANIRPSRMFVVHTFEYSNEQTIIADGQKYSVIRTYPLNDDELEVYVEQKVGDQNGE